MTRALHLLLALCAASILQAFAPDDSIAPSQIALDQTISQVTVEVADPVYLKTKRYQGYPLQMVVRQYLAAAASPSLGDELVFHTRDGYNPSLPVSDAISGRAVIATRDLDATGPAHWIPFMSNGQPTTPGDYYLVWTGEVKLAQRFPWPYQIESIELVKASAFHDAEPPLSASARVKQGYDLFRHTCMKCHSINFVGGLMGGELNVPLNATEYWQRGPLLQFVESPRSVRATSKMPKLGISSPDARLIGEYLQVMAGHKVCRSAAACAARKASP